MYKYASVRRLHADSMFRGLEVRDVIADLHFHSPDLPGLDGVKDLQKFKGKETKGKGSV